MSPFGARDNNKFVAYGSLISIKRGEICTLYIKCGQKLVGKVNKIRYFVSFQ